MRSHRFTAALVALAAVVASCGSSHTGAVKVKNTTTTEPATTTTASTTTTTVSPEAAVLAGYRGQWDDFIAVGMAPDGTDPRLAAHATGAELVQVRKYFTDYRAKGLVQRGTVELSPRVVSITGSTALVRDCYLSHLQDVDAKTGRVVASDPAVRKLAESPMQLEAGVWKVANVFEKGTGCTSA